MKRFRFHVYGKQVQQERTTKGHRKLQKERRLVEKERSSQKRQRTVYITKKKANNADLSIISDDDDFECYNKSEGQPVQTNIDDVLQLLPKETNLAPEQGRYTGKTKIEKPTESVRRSNRLPFARQTEKLGGVPFYTNNKKN